MPIGRAGVRQTRSESRRARGGGEFTTWDPGSILRESPGKQPRAGSAKETQSRGLDPAPPVSYCLEAAPEK